MTGLIVPLLIAVASVAGFALVLHRRAQAGRAFDRVLADRGFSPRAEDPGAAVDFTITLQWPDARGITYLKQFTKKDAGSVLTVANVQCWQVTGARMAQLGAAMRPDGIRQTVMSCRFPDRELPRLCLCPRIWAEQFRNFSEGASEITTGDAAFDGAFFIVGPGTEGVAALLTDSVRAQMLSLSDIMVASGNGSVLLFRQAAVLAPRELGRFLDLLDTIRKEMTTGLP